MKIERIALMLILTGAPALSVLAGEVVIGRNMLIGGTKPGTCHTSSFLGPDDAVKNYEKRQKERFEKVDPDTLDRLKAGVFVDVEVVTYKQNWCAQNSGVPEKIVIVKPGSDDPVLVIPLTPEEAKLGNMLGAKFTATNGTATVPIEDIRKLAGVEYEFHLVYSDHGYKDKWSADYADKILKAPK